MDAEKLTAILGYVLLAFSLLNILMVAAKAILEKLAEFLKQEKLGKVAVTLGKIIDGLAKLVAVISANTNNKPTPTPEK